MLLYYDTHNLNCTNISFCLCCFGLFREGWIIDSPISIFFARSFIMFSNFDNKLYSVKKNRVHNKAPQCLVTE